jgi:2-succinyl-6-hydroxy-2,4-cyclohexadiene-1-carboxylate synthase
MTGPFHLPRSHVRVAGVELAVAELGAAADPGTVAVPPLLVLHGFTGCAESMLPVAAPLARARRVVLPDLVGHGRSAVAEPGHCTIEAVVEQLDALLDAVAGIGGSPAVVDVLGYSMGGRIALSLAVARPGRVRRVAVVGASAGIADPDERRARRAADAALAARLRTEGLERFVDDWTAQPLFATQAGLPSVVGAEARAQRLASPPEGLARSLEGMGTGAMRPLHAALGSLPVPVLLLAGALDHRYTVVARELAALLPAGRWVVVDGAGHAAHLERPDVLVAEVERFLGSPEVEGPTGAGDARSL